jgi:hypothetical protein
MEATSRQRLARPFMSLIVTAGVLVCLVSVYRLSVANLDLRLALLIIMTIGIGSRLGVKIPGTKGEITVSDSLIFLTILMFDGEVAVLLAAAEAVCTSFRFTTRKFLYIFNGAVMACSTFVTVEVLRHAFGPVTNLSDGAYSNVFVIALCMMALVQYIFNSGVVATVAALRADEPVWQTWKHNYLWTSITYFAGASAAGVIAKLVGVAGFYAFVALVPIIAIVNFTYWN